jgi:hypothetical protein
MLCSRNSAAAHRALLLKLLAMSAVVLLVAAPSLCAQMVETWQKAAVQKHPSLAQAGSPLNQRFLAIVAEKRKSEPVYFTRPDWPMRAADAAAAALQAEELAVTEKAKAEEEARLAKMAPEERDWERDKARWVFERLVFGDSEEVITSKLSHSKLITSRVAPSARVPLGSRFQWVIGESKFHLDFEKKDGLAAIVVESLPETTDNLDGFIHDDWAKLRAAAVGQFGPPAKTIAYPDAKALHTGGWTATDTWDRPGSRIKLGVIEDSGKCTATLRISNPARGAE